MPTEAEKLDSVVDAIEAAEQATLAARELAIHIGGRSEADLRFALREAAAMLARAARIANRMEPAP